jgi:hypothetical protein
VFSVLAPWWPSQESDRTEIWLVQSFHLGVHTCIVCIKFQVNSPSSYETCPANGQRTPHDCVIGSRSKVASTGLFWAIYLCPLIHPHTKYQPKMFIRLGDTERKGISVTKVTGSRLKVASTRFFRATHLCPLIHPPTKYPPKIFIRFEDTEQKGIIMQVWVKVSGSRSKVTSTQIFVPC